MKKLIGLPLAGILMAGMLSLVAPAPANASCTGPYTAGCNPTEPQFNLPPTFDFGTPLVFRFVVINVAGDRDPSGFVFFQLVRVGAGRADAGSAQKATNVVWKKKVKYTGEAIRVKGPKLNKVGKFTLVAKFKAPGKKPFKTSKSKETFRVTR